ncbi:MAG: hydroxyacid dehydrogenase [Peptococcaceae bacterium]|jgi:phosphoglycerate dehydrogenase-like enzyme|nr:hydroxyacid dehydrogenase [Peptococcaceae bacterium]
MKILIIGDKYRYDWLTPRSSIPPDAELVFFDTGTDDSTLIRAGADADILLADAIAKVSRNLIAHMPNLRLIHSEGVGYDAIDIGAAKERGIFVCNNKGCNATAVAEQALLLMLGLLRSVVPGDRSVRQGNQYEAKLNAMRTGITELRYSKVGLVGMGAIGQSTATLLRVFECDVYYYSPHRRDELEESYLAVSYLPLDELVAKVDILSLHAAVTPESAGLVNAELLSRMKPTAYLINTARGELVDNAALREAIITGRIAGAGLDTIYPEPTTKDNPLVDLPPEHQDKVLYSPHFGGITTASMYRAQRHMWQNVARVARGDRPDCIVNGV